MWSAPDSDKPFKKTIPHDRHATILIMISAPARILTI
jgi:hypothetical protein